MNKKGNQDQRLQHAISHLAYELKMSVQDVAEYMCDYLPRNYRGDAFTDALALARVEELLKNENEKVEVTIGGAAYYLSPSCLPLYKKWLNELT